MDDQDRVSQASSVATISYFPVRTDSNGKVQTFGKRCQAAKRDPNCPVVIRGWLNKKDSWGLKLWKRRWFVLSDFCLFYYKDSREESVLGSIPLPSYKILFCTPRECKNRKFTFKVVHQGMRSYFFSADTQEDMLGWVRALSQSAAMELHGSMNRRCSSYQDFTQIGGSSESVDFPKSPSDGEGPPQKAKHVGRTLSEPLQLSGGRMGTSPADQRGGRRRTRQRNSSPSARTPSPPEFSRRRIRANQEEDFLPYQSGHNSPPPHADLLGAGSLTPRGQLGSRPHTPVGRVDIRPQDEPLGAPDAPYYTPASPKTEFRSTPTTPVTERWQKLSKPTPTYASVHHLSGGRRPLGKSFPPGAHADLLPPLPPSSRAVHAPAPPHHHQRSHFSVCVLPPALQKPDPRETPPLRPLESDADAVLTRLCGCDKLLQSLSGELAQLQVDKDSVQCALEVSRLQLDEWSGQGPRAPEEALTQKALLQEELVTIRARMCDVTLEMERVWGQYERMESELSIIRSHLQHICNFGMPQDHSQAQRELWMMEDILAGLKVNRDHFRFLLGLHRHPMFPASGPHPGSPAPPTERLMNVDPEAPARPPLPQELQETNVEQRRGRTESAYEGIYGPPADGARHPDLLNVKAQRNASESGWKWITPDTTTQSTKKVKMSEEEQMERMKRNQERMSNRKNPPLPAPCALSQSSQTQEAPFPLRVTRVVTAVLPSSLVARRVSVEDPPPELDTPLPERILPDEQHRAAELRKKNKPLRRSQPESGEPGRPAEHQDQTLRKTSRLQLQGESMTSEQQSRPAEIRAEPAETAEERPSVLLTSDLDPDLCLTPEQRDAKLKRVERIRQRVLQSAVRAGPAHHQLPVDGQEVLPGPRDLTSGQQTASPDHDSSECCYETDSRRPLEPLPGDEDKHWYVETAKNQVTFGSRSQHVRRAGVATKIKRPASPYHISSMTVYQREGGLGFTSCKDGQEPDKVAAGAADVSPSSLRSQWFLSTNHRHGFIPLQISDTCSEEASCNDDDVADVMWPTFSQSLEKMQQNTSLFYKIACDISISDSDINKNDGNASAGREEEEEPLIAESALEEETRSRPESKVNQSTAEPDGKPASDVEILQKEQEGLKQVKVQDATSTTCAQTRDGKSETTEPEERGVDREKREGLFQGQERGNTISSSSSLYDGGRVLRSASVGKARVTVLRTSL